ncbi:hypothetical protein TNCV_1931101 [Trichonephila clavipes]|nr:hypothetical protein TNCV_1931101 [Trichonephila clavipes]
MVAAELRSECITCSFVIDELRITKLFRGYIVNFMIHVRSTSPDMMLYVVQAWKEEFRTLYLLESSQVQQLLLITTSFESGRLSSPAELLPMSGTNMCATSGANSCAEQLL